VLFGAPASGEDPYFGGVGPRRTGCVSCGNCQVGCGHNAKNKVTTNYLYLAEKLGVEIHELHEVYDLVPLDGGGFEVHARHPGWAQRAAHLHHHTYTAEQVIVAAHAYGSSKLLHHMQHKGRLRSLSSQLGQRARTNSEQLLVITRPWLWKDNRKSSRIGRDHLWRLAGRVTSIEPVYYRSGAPSGRYLCTAAETSDSVLVFSRHFEHPAQAASVTRATASERAANMLCGTRLTPLVVPVLA
jgi:cholesterol oxidase